MKIGLIDVDGHNYPNIPLMKLSAWHKQNGDSVQWYDALYSDRFDIVYKSKVFSFSPDYPYHINADRIIEGGTGYAISVVNGRECYDKSKDINLPDEVEHIYPDYGIYPQFKDTAYGFLTRGCPRNCSFCHVTKKEGCSHKVADLNEFWNGQKTIELCDPNVLACAEWGGILEQLIKSKAKVNFNQGLDIRFMTEAKADMINQIKIKWIHFAWDRYEDIDMIIPKFEMFRKKSNIKNKDLMVYVLTGDIEQRIRKEDLKRIYWLRDNGYAPYVTIYNKDALPIHHELRKLQRWVNNRWVFWSCNRFEDYLKVEQKRTELSRHEQLTLW